METRIIQLVVDGHPGQVVGPLMVRDLPVPARAPLDCRCQYHLRRPCIQLSCASRFACETNFYTAFPTLGGSLPMFWQEDDCASSVTSFVAVIIQTGGFLPMTWGRNCNLHMAGRSERQRFGV